MGLASPQYGAGAGVGAISSQRHKYIDLFNSTIVVFRYRTDIPSDQDYVPATDEEPFQLMFIAEAHRIDFVQPESVNAIP